MLLVLSIIIVYIQQQQKGIFLMSHKSTQIGVHIHKYSHRELVLVPAEFE